MNRPSMFAQAITRDDLRFAEKWGARALQLAMGVFLVYQWLGGRIGTPNDRLNAAERRQDAVDSTVRALGSRIAKVEAIAETSLRIQCLGMNRRDAQLSGVCREYPTRGETLSYR